MSLGGLCKRNDSNLLMKRVRKKALISPKLDLESIHLRQIIPSDSYSACIKLSEKNITTHPVLLGVYSFTRILEYE